MGHEGLIIRASRYTKGSKTALEPTIRLLAFMSLKLIQFADNSRHLIQFPHSASESCGEKFSLRTNIEPKRGESFTPEVNCALCSLFYPSLVVESCRLPGPGTSSSSRRAFGCERRASCRRANDASSTSSHPLPKVCLMSVSCGCSSCR